MSLQKKQDTFQPDETGQLVYDTPSAATPLECLTPHTLSLEEAPVPPGPLPPRHFLRQTQNSGLAIPYFLNTEEKAAIVAPPARVKTLSERIAEFSEKEQQKIDEMTKLVQERGWFDCEDFTVDNDCAAAAVKEENSDAKTPMIESRSAVEKASMNEQELFATLAKEAGKGLDPETGRPVRTDIIGGKFDCDKWRVIRYLVARNFDVSKAMEMLKASIEWEGKNTPRKTICMKCETGPDAHMMQFCGWDLLHRPIVYASFALAAARDDPADALTHCNESFEFLKRQMPAGVEQWTCVTDFLGYSHMRDGNPKVGRVVTDALQNHYPERLGLYIFIDPPTSFWFMWKLLQPFIDAKTKAKVAMVYTDEKEKKNGCYIEQVMEQHFPPHVTEYLMYLAKYIRLQRSKKKK